MASQSTHIRRVFVIDDHRDTAESLARAVQAMGHDADSARSGDEALEKAPQFRPDVVFLDLVLPDIFVKPLDVRIVEDLLSS